MWLIKDKNKKKKLLGKSKTGLLHHTTITYIFYFIFLLDFHY